MAVSAIFFSIVVFTSAYIVGAVELWPFKKLAEGGSGDGWHKESWKDTLKGEDMPAEVMEVHEVMRSLKGAMDEAILSQKRFLADASHEMRSPITVMKGNIEIALRRERDVGEYQRVLESNLEEIDRLEFLVKDLMFLARADASELAMNMAPTLLDEVLAVVVYGLMPLAENKGIELTLDFEEGHEYEIKGDADRLRQLFVNLVENSLRYTQSGGKVAVTLGKVEGVNQAVVSDTGIGIPEAELGKIFERFYRVDRARARHSGGTGLGLCICKWIVEAHNGEITVDSKEGEGTKVTVMFLQV